MATATTPGSGHAYSAAGLENVALSLAIITVLMPLALALVGALGLAAVVLIHEIAEVFIANGVRAGAPDLEQDRRLPTRPGSPHDPAQRPPAADHLAPLPRRDVDSGPPEAYDASTATPL